MLGVHFMAFFQPLNAKQKFLAKYRKNSPTYADLWVSHRISKHLSLSEFFKKKFSWSKFQFNEKSKTNVEAFSFRKRCL